MSSQDHASNSQPQAEPPELTGKQARLYGRHVGKPLRPRQKELLADLLPRVTLTPESLSAASLEAAFGRKPAPLALEIGFGGGEHLALQALAHPDICFIGCEHFQNGIAGLLGRMAANAALTNIRLYPADARHLIAALPAACLDRVFLLFPDPWPKKRHIERRFLQRETLSLLARAMKPGARLTFASDMPFLVDWMQAQALAHPDFAPLAGTLAGRHAQRPDVADAPVTRYEQKAIDAGRIGIYLDFVKA